MFETLVHDFEESLCEVYLDLFIKSEDQRLLALEDEETSYDDREYRFCMMSEILSHMKHLTLLGNQAKQVKYISQYCFRQLLINIDIVEEVDLGDLIKTLSIT